MPPRTLCLVLGLALAAVPVPAPAQPVALEFRVKAAFLLNFTRFIEWPPAMRRTERAFVVCVLSPDPFGLALEATLADERWQGRPFVVRRLTGASEVRSCHLLYVPRDQTARFAQARAALTGSPTLTVGESLAFLDAGGMIAFHLDHNQVRFSVDRRATDRASLQVSSRLLRLAREVRDHGGDRP